MKFSYESQGIHRQTIFRAPLKKSPQRNKHPDTSSITRRRRDSTMNQLPRHVNKLDQHTYPGYKQQPFATAQGGTPNFKLHMSNTLGLILVYMFFKCNTSTVTAKQTRSGHGTILQPVRISRVYLALGAREYLVYRPSKYIQHPRVHELSTAENINVVLCRAYR